MVAGSWHDPKGEHASLEAQDSEFLRDERAVRALGAFDALDSALSGFEGSSSGPGVSSGGSWHDPKVVAGSWHDPKVVAPEGSAAADGRPWGSLWDTLRGHPTPPTPSSPRLGGGSSSGHGAPDGEGVESLRPDVAAAVPLAVPGRFGRGFGRKPDVTPTAGGIQHDCRTFGCFRQAAGPAGGPTAVGIAHCCVLCFQTEGGRHMTEGQLWRPRVGSPDSSICQVATTQDGARMSLGIWTNQMIRPAWTRLTA